MTVAVEIGGVDDPDGADAFRLVVPGEASTADAARRRRLRRDDRRRRSGAR